MPKRLESAYSVTVDMDDKRSVFQGHRRIVRSARRARALRKRGVEVDCYTNPMGIGGIVRRFWAWYETEASYRTRAVERKRRALLRRAIREAKATGGLDWVETLLRQLGQGLMIKAKALSTLLHDFSEVEARVLSDLQTKGYSIQIDQPSDIQRAARKSPNMRVYYLDPMLTCLTIEPFEGDIEVDIE